MRFRSLTVALLALPFCLAAHADVTATLPSSGISYSTNLGTFSYSIPMGEDITSATVELEGFDSAYVGSTDFYLDGSYLGSISNYFSPKTVSYTVSDLSVLADGLADLTFVIHDSAGAPAILGTGGETLTVGTSVTPEPSSFMLLGTGLLGMLGIAKRRFA